MILKINQDKMREMVSEWIFSEEKSIIELGCNDGNFAFMLNKFKIRNYIGIDIQKDKIDLAKKKLPNMNFICCDITKNLHMLAEVTMFISFQCLEHIHEDLDVLKALKEKTKVIISVPNRPYKGHIRWFELDGWKKRFSPYIGFNKIITIQHPKKVNNRSFLFEGVSK